MYGGKVEDLLAANVESRILQGNKSPGDEDFGLMETPKYTNFAMEEIRRWQIASLL